MVFAHYMLANLDYVADSAGQDVVIHSYEREIRQAQAVGIDGFALNAGGWFKEPRYIRRASQMFEAALRLHTGFKLFFSADMCCSNDLGDVEDMMRRFAGNPRYAEVYYRKDGKAVLTTFAGEARGPEFWQRVRRDLEQGSNPSSREASNAIEGSQAAPSSEPLPIFLVPSFFWGGELPDQAQIHSGVSPYQAIIDGAFYWGIAGVPGLGQAPDQLPSSDAYARELRDTHKLYMAPICFQFWGANAGRYYEYSGYEGMRAMWMDAIKVSHPQWVEIITWNDFVEGTYVSPIDDPARYAGANDLGGSIAPASTIGFFHSHQGASALMKYFIEWYKSGHSPPIQRDALYWAYRTQPIATSTSLSPGINIHGPAANVVYITTNLTSPAILRVSFGGESRTVSLKTGSTDTQVPMAAGSIPRIELRRGSRLLGIATGGDAVSAVSQYPNLYYSTGVLPD